LGKTQRDGNDLRKGKMSKIFNFDNSILADSATCIAAAIVKHVHGRQGRKRGLYGDLGNLVHHVLDKHFRGASKSEAMREFDPRYGEVIPEGEGVDEPAFERENIRKIVEKYIDTHPIEAMPFRVLETEKMIGVEVAEGMKFWGKRDALIEEKATGMICPLDHKTRWGTITEWWTKKFRMGSQFSGYIWLTQEVDKGIGNKCYVNALSMGKLPDSNRMCKKHGLPFIECQLEHCDFQLLIYLRTDEQIAAWKRDMVYLAKQTKTFFDAYGGIELLKYAPRSGAFNEGCTFCEFQEWCKNDFELELRDELTVYKPWMPWEQVEDGKATNSVGYHWIWDEGEGRIFPSEKLISGMKVIPAAMALKKLWEMGREEWMRVWGMGIAQGEMAEFARGME
jgi:hypothetical protein